MDNKKNNKIVEKINNQRPAWPKRNDFYSYIRILPRMCANGQKMIFFSYIQILSFSILKIIYIIKIDFAGIK